MIEFDYFWLFVIIWLVIANFMEYYAICENTRVYASI